MDGDKKTKSKDANRKNSKVIPKQLPNIKEVEENILQVVKGQDEQVRTIVTATYRALKLNNMKANVLIMGGSGTGKTEILKQLAKQLNRVYVIEDANEFTQEGYHGRSVSDIIKDLIVAAEYDIKEAERGIVIIDEIDKKAARPTLERDVSGLGVLNSLLKLVEGKKFRLYDGPEYDPDRDDFYTDNLIIFFAGAFSDMNNIKKKMKGSQVIGFSHQDNFEDSKIETRQIKQDLIDYGFTDEFVGRIDTIVQLNELSEEVLADILKNSRESIFRKYRKELQKYGIRLRYRQTIFEDIARKAKTANTGARELANIVNYIFEKILYEIFSAEKGEYHICILQEGIERDNTNYTLK